MERLCILSCGDFYPDVAAAVAAEGWEDVSVAAFPPDCAMPPLDWEQIRQHVPADCTQLVLVGNICLKQLSASPPGMPPVEVVALEECFDLVAPAELVREKITDGAYLMTPSWLQGWENRMRARGFDRSAAAEFFQDFARKLVLLDTRPDGKGGAWLEKMSEAVGLPASRVAVGLDEVRKRLRPVVCQWRERGKPGSDGAKLREDADLAATLELMAQIAVVSQESEVAAQIREIFLMLFAPARLHYFPAERGVLQIPDDAPAAVAQEAVQFAGAYAWTASGRGFLVRLNRGEQTLAVVVAEDLAFPEYKDRYLTMALSLAKVSALALESARNRRSLIEAEKMASLSVLVAGVAHEVNTPVGVCLAAASTLESQLSSLSAKFTERSMKQSDLSRYLEASSAETHLIVSNLERMGRIIESFRKAAVERTQPVKKPFLFRAMLEQSIELLGTGTLGSGLTVIIDCDPKFMVQSYVGDWASIITNLYTNALRHAFKDRDHGEIRIAARVEGKELVIEFADDGVGLQPEVRKRIFDPFYTTDMQRGMGLGLHLVYNLVRRCLGGTIVCESTPGAGALFRIVSPL